MNRRTRRANQVCPDTTRKHSGETRHHDDDYDGVEPDEIIGPAANLSTDDIIAQ